VSGVWGQGQTVGSRICRSNSRSLPSNNEKSRRLKQQVCATPLLTSGSCLLRELHLLGGHLGQNGQAVLDLEAFNLSVPEFLAEAHEGYPRGMNPVTELPVAGQLAVPGPPQILPLVGAQ